MLSLISIVGYVASRMTIRFKNDIINKHRSDFRGGQKRVYTSFKFRKDTQYKGLYLCEYPNGDKHFIIKYYLSGHRKKKKIFAIRKFNPHTIKTAKLSLVLSNVKKDYLRLLTSIQITKDCGLKIPNKR